MDQWQPTPDEPAFLPPEAVDPQRGSRRGLTGLAWGLITIAVLAKVILPLVLLAPAATAIGPDPVGELLIGIQGRYLVGAADFTPQGEVLYQQVAALDIGSLEQRQRVVVLAGELGGAAEARSHLDELRADLDAKVAEGRLAPSEDDLEVLRILGVIYPGAGPATDPDTDASASNDLLTEDERRFLSERLGWFGDLALSPDDETLRAEVMARAQETFYLIVGAFGVGIVAGVAGFGGLIALVVLSFMRRLASGVPRGASHHGIYAETFAIWLAVFLGLQIGAGELAALMPSAQLLIVLAAFFVSLLVLAWPCARGIPWRQVRQDIGWTAGRQPALEPLMGIVGYAMALPILAGGVLLTFVFLLIDAALAGTPEKLASAAGPAHPIVAELGSGNWMVLVQILLLGSVAAPIIEETMFRGVLYRHLRDATRGQGPLISIVLSSLINAFVFAIIHPQGWVAVPALMSLAIAFSLAREWRGTVIPAMIMHGVSNGLVLGLITILASV